MSKGKAIPQGEAAQLVEPLLAVLGPTAKIAGSLRRGKERVHDVDVVVAQNVDLDAVRKVVTRVVEAGEKKIRVKVRKGLQVDIVVTDKEHHGAALLYLTGPREFNLAMRATAKDMGLKLNEKGLWKVTGKGKRTKEKLVAAKTEREIFDALGLKFVFPSSRSADSLFPKVTEGVIHEIPSSKGDKTYKVVVQNGKPRCSCKGFAFRKTCRHAKQVAADLAA